jgi:hypothetical protein
VPISNTRCPSRTSRLSSILVISPGMLEEERSAPDSGGLAMAVSSAVLE